MAYQDYQEQMPQMRPQVLPQQPGAQVGGSVFGSLAPSPASGLQMAPAPTMPDANAPQQGMPPSTRQQNLAQVQQAYLPGQGPYLEQLLQRSSAPVSLSDPGLQPSIAAGRLSDDRQFGQARAALAERLGAGGLGNSGALAGKEMQLRQAIGEGAAQREAGLVQNEMNNRRSALLSALGIDQNRYQFDNDLGFRLAQLQQQMNQSALAPFLSY